MDPITMAAIMGGLGLAKSELVDRPAANRQRKTEAEIARWSPWTGMAAQRTKDADSFGATVQGGLAGAALGQNAEQTAKMNEMMKSQKALLDAQTAQIAAGNGAGLAGAVPTTTTPLPGMVPGTYMQPGGQMPPGYVSPWTTWQQQQVPPVAAQ